MDRERARAVVVDDDPFFRRVVGTCLRTLDFDVATMESGYELVRYCMRNGDPFDLALLDLDMPLLGGLETARTIELFLPRQRVVFMGEAASAVVPEGSLYLPKPLDFTVLIEYARRLREGERALPPVAAAA